MSDNLIDDIDNLIKQATKERSHYYVKSVLERCKDALLGKTPPPLTAFEASGLFRPVSIKPHHGIGYCPACGLSGALEAVEEKRETMPPHLVEYAKCRVCNWEGRVYHPSLSPASVRDILAAAALTGLLAAKPRPIDKASLASQAYEIADAGMRERKKC